jgi:hypothetical protein
LFNPEYYADGKKNGRGASFELANFLGFFVVSVENNGRIHGIIASVSGMVNPNAGPTAVNMFPKAIRLVE